MKLLLVSCFVLLALIAEARFSLGNRFQYANIEGQLTVTCSNQSRIVICRDTFMDPWPYDLFMGPRSGKATQVQLRSVVGNEAQVVTASYEGSAGQSSEINLGVLSLFQKPLLKIGTNRISWALLDRNNNAIDTDRFDVVVDRGPARRCPDRQIISPSQNDCDHPYTVCQLYFRTENFCRPK
jgi:hypothetical protein